MNSTIKRLTILAAVFAPFLMTGAALLVLPDPWQTLRNTHGEDWIWLILLGALQVADLVLTRLFLAHGVHEANPLGRLLLGSGTADLAKLASDSAQVDIEGSGHATIAPAHSADLTISGDGEIDVTSHPADIE